MPGSWFERAVGSSSLSKGVFVNPNAGLLLRFMLNPDEMTISKDTSFDQEEIPGVEAPEITWGSGGPKTISFTLFFDQQGGNDILGRRNFPDTLGVQPIESILESWLVPQTTSLEKLDLSEFSFGTVAREIADAFQVDKYIGPPILYFVHGTRWWKCYLTSADFQETAFNDALVPVQMETDVELLVIEDGSFQKYAEARRKSLASFETLQMGLDLVL